MQRNAGGQNVQRERIACGQCPNCGKEAAPYRLCWNCRAAIRFNRQIKRGQRHGVLRFMDGGTRLTKDTLIWRGDKIDDPEALKAWDKWQPAFEPRESDRRALPRLRGIRVDVESTLVEVIRHIGRPCTIEEIMAAWGRLRERRSSPLASDLACIIAAEDKRKRRAAKRADIAARQAAE